MGGRSQRPNPADYEPGPSEKMNAAVAKASNDYYVTKLQPLLIKQNLTEIIINIVFFLLMFNF